MPRYTLKTFCGSKQLERYDHRSPDKLQSILDHPRYHRAGETSPWGEPLHTADRFEIFDSQMEKIFDGNVTETIAMAKALK